MSGSYEVAVIGGGHNGLVAAAYMAGAGLRTVLLEARERCGGILATEAIAAGFKTPSLTHSMGRLSPTVADDLSLYRRGLHLIQPEVRAFAPQLDSPPVTLWGSVARTMEELRPLSRSDATAYAAFDARVRSVAGFMATLNATTPVDLEHASLSDALSGLKLARAFKSLSKKDAQAALRYLSMSVGDFVGEAFETDALRGLLATRGIQQAGLGVHSAGTAAVFLNDCSGTDPGAAGHAIYARGGSVALADALVAAARSFGAEIRTGSEVCSVMTSGEQVTGVALQDGSEIAARCVVSSADPKRTLRLLDPLVLGPTLRWRAENIRTPGVVAKVDFALGGLPSWARQKRDDLTRLQGRIVIAPGIDGLERAFDATKYGRVSESPYIDALIPTLVDKSLAPDGKHVMSCSVQYAPYHRREGDWDSDKDGLADLVLKTLETYAPGFVDLVIERRVLTPLDLERDFGLTEGHPLHAEPALDQFWAWRPLLGHAGYRFGVTGLYLGGSGAHPGGGITGIPGANAARTVIKDLRRRR